MFRCVARLRTQYPHHLWYAAFDDDAPTRQYVIREAQRYGAHDTLIIPWALANATPQTPHHPYPGGLGQHPLMRDIVIQRANEGHYLRNPSTYHEHNTHTIFVGAADTSVHGIVHQALDQVLAHAHHLPPNTILQPLALSQHDPLVLNLKHHTARGMPLERCDVGHAVEYDRRLLTIIHDMVRHYAK